jgi:hypothetical protein
MIFHNLVKQLTCILKIIFEIYNKFAKYDKLNNLNKMNRRINDLRIFLIWKNRVKIKQSKYAFEFSI